MGRRGSPVPCGGRQRNLQSCSARSHRAAASSDAPAAAARCPGRRDTDHIAKPPSRPDRLPGRENAKGSRALLPWPREAWSDVAPSAAGSSGEGGCLEELTSSSLLQMSAGGGGERSLPSAEPYGWGWGAAGSLDAGRAPCSAQPDPGLQAQSWGRHPREQVRPLPATPSVGDPGPPWPEQAGQQRRGRVAWAGRALGVTSGRRRGQTSQEGDCPVTPSRNGSPKGYTVWKSTIIACPVPPPKHWG